MDSRYAYGRAMPQFSGATGWALLATGVWLRLAFAGASALVAGLLLVLAAEGKASFALALALGGGVVAVISWERAQAALDRAAISAGPRYAPRICPPSTTRS